MYESNQPLYFYPYATMQDYYRKNEEHHRLYDPKEATIHGNLFVEEYKPYLNYIPKIRTPKNEREAMLWEIAFFANAAHDLALYLAVDPTEQEYIQLYSTYAKKAEEAKTVYTQKYGPLCVKNGKEKNGLFDYVTTPSPWLGM